MTPRYAAKADSNQAEIVHALRSVGADVFSLHRVGHGCPDIICGWQGCNYLFEIKTETGKLTEQEREFICTWSGQVSVVRCPEDALRILGLLESEE